MPGGASAYPQISDRGKVLKIEKSTGKVELIASGLRTPNGIGIGIDNEIFIADNQGIGCRQVKLYICSRVHFMVQDRLILRVQRS